MKTENVDVLVVGGGTAGVPAAIGAARQGAKVLLLEAEPHVGGTITGSYVTMPCGGTRTGVYAEMLARLRQDHLVAGGSQWFMPSGYLQVMNEFLAREPNVRVVCGARGSTPIVEDGPDRPRVAGVTVPGPDGKPAMEVRAAITIDATGEGGLAAAAGCEEMYGTEGKDAFGEPHAPGTAVDTVQLVTWMYISQKVGDGPAFDMTQLQRGGLDPALAWFGWDTEANLQRDSGICLHWGCAVPCRDTRDPVAVAEAQQDALAAMEDDHEALRRGGYAVDLAPKIGIRESRRIVGEHILTENDLRRGGFPTDTVAIGTWWLDCWGGLIPEDERYVPPVGVPYRCLVPRGMDGLLVAGKAISATHIAIASVRVQPIVSTVGQAAGVAAAMCAAAGAPTRDLNPQRLRQALIDPRQGIELYN